MGVITTALALPQDCFEEQLRPLITSPMAGPQLTPPIHTASQLSSHEAHSRLNLPPLAIPRMRSPRHPQLVPHFLEGGSRVPILERPSPTTQNRTVAPASYPHSFSPTLFYSSPRNIFLLHLTCSFVLLSSPN